MPSSEKSVKGQVGGRRPGAGRPRRPLTVAASEGQRLLLAEPGMLRELSHASGVSVQALSDYRGGLKRPSPEARAKLAAAFGIPEASWHRRPGDEHGRRGTLAAVSDARAVELDDDDDESDDAELDVKSAPTALEDVKTLLEAIKRDRVQPDLLPAERVKLAAAEARILKLRASLEQAAEYSEARYVLTHPAWLALRRAIVSALEPYPSAASAVVDAIARIESAKVLRP